MTVSHLTMYKVGDDLSLQAQQAAELSFHKYA